MSTTEHKITLHYMDQEKSDSSELCNHLFFQTRPLNFSNPHTKRISKLVLKSMFKTFDDEYAAWLVYGSNTLDDWELITYNQMSNGLDVFTTRLIGNYKYFIVVFGSGKNTLIQQIDAVESERFTQTFR